MTEPTDAELLALIEKHLGLKPRRDDMVIDPRTGRFHDVQRYRDMKADILAKWGTPPAVAGEPVAWEAAVPGYIKYVTQSRYERFSAIAKSGYKPYKCSNCTTPQPTQAQAGAVPLTPFISAQRERLFYNRPENVSKGATMADWHRVVQYIEAAHGIKGGQHGAE